MDAEDHFGALASVWDAQAEAMNAAMGAHADAARRGYVSAVEAFREDYRASCFRAGIDYVPLDTSMQFDRALMEDLVSRRNRF